MPTPLKTLVNAIHDGDYDEKLDLVSRQVYNALRGRRYALDAKAASKIKVGSHVRVTGTIKPRYMVGAEGTVTSIDGRRVWIQLTKPIIRHGNVRTRTIGNIGVSASEVTVIKDET